MNLLGLTRRADGVGKGELALVEPADEQATGLVQAAVNARQPICEIFGGPGVGPCSASALTWARAASTRSRR